MTTTMDAKTRTRRAAVAGLFYPDEPDHLSQQVDALLEKAAIAPVTPRALIAPHAGYIYSGSIAATAYATLATEAARFRKVVLLGPSHRVPLRGCAVSSAHAYATPLGQVPVAADLVRQLVDTGVAKFNDLAHADEHSLEVQLPFLQRLLPDFSLLPVLVGQTEPEIVFQLIDSIEAPDTLCIVSSDLSHYHDYATAQSLDAATTVAIEKYCTDLKPEQACGCQPLNGLLFYAKQRGLDVSTLAVCNSGDTAGPLDRVVGYGAYVLH